MDLAVSELTLDDARALLARRFEQCNVEDMEATILLLTIVCEFDTDDLGAILHEEVVKLDHAKQTYWLGERCTCGNALLHG